MTQTVSNALDRLAATLKMLPEETQAAVVAEIESHVASLASSQMSDGQRAVVAERLGKPRHYTDRGEVETILQRYKSLG